MANLDLGDLVLSQPQLFEPRKRLEVLNALPTVSASRSP